MLEDLAHELDIFVEGSKLHLEAWLFAFAGLWGINILNWFLGSKLNILGIHPRHPLGVLGIAFCPILHQNFTHLFFNTIPLFMLGLSILARGVPIFCQVTFFVVVFGGLAVWAFGRRAVHIGASGLVSGYFGYILATAYFEPSFTTLILAIFVIYYFGSIFLGIFPQEEKVSWESHLFGFLSGIGAAYVMR